MNLLLLYTFGMCSNKEFKTLGKSKMKNDVLYYITNPFCPWCWAFAPVIDNLSSFLPEEIPIRYIMGYLSQNTKKVITSEQKEMQKQAWRNVSEVSEVKFNFKFWEDHNPKKITDLGYRAVVAVEFQQFGASVEMFNAIQYAYFVEAKNIFELNTLTQIVGEIGLDRDLFVEDIFSDKTKIRYKKELALCDYLEANKTPTLILNYNDSILWINYGYQSEKVVIDLLNSALLA